MRGEDARDRGKAIGNNQPARQKDERVVQHKCQCNDSNGEDDNGDDDRTDNNDDNNYVGGCQHREIHHVLS